MTTGKPSNFEEYFAAFPPEVRAVLEQVRTAIRRAAPVASEVISYGIPTFTTPGGHLVHFAAFKNHLGFYATPTGHEAFQRELSAYKQGKGSVQFPLDQPMPLDLIERIVRFRVEKVAEKMTVKKRK